MIACLVFLSLVTLLVGSRILGHYEALLLIRRVRVAGGLLAETAGALRLRWFAARRRNPDMRTWSELWQDLHGRFADLGGVSLELTCHGVREEQVISRLSWTEAKLLDNHVSAWEFRYSVSREDQLRVLSTATGYSSDRRPPQSFDEVMRLLDACFRQWPVGQELARPRMADDGELATHPIAAELADQTDRLPVGARRAA